MSGVFSVGKRRLDEWLDDFISSNADAGTLNVFANRLAKTLEREMTPDEKAEGSMIHVAGFVQDGDGAHPEFYAVRNIKDIDPVTGNYINIVDTFMCDEQFWNRDYPQEGLRTAIESGRSFMYFNGFPPGRISFLGVSQKLTEFFDAVWNNGDWRFRAPRTLDERAALLKLQMSDITTLFKMSDYPAPYIGGMIRMISIEPPGGALWL